MNAHVDFTNKSSQRQHRLLALANYIEKSSTFSMATWRTCIAGKCSDMIREDFDEGRTASDYLGLTSAEEFHLFTPKGVILPDSIRYDLGYLTKIDKAWAVRTLRYFAYTGKIDWIANEAGGPQHVYKRRTYLPPCSIREVAYLA